MATLPTQNFTELDFAKLKQGLKDYLSTRPEFVDFNFDGSFISILLDTLAYNSQNIAFYANMLGSEFFLDTAQRRESVVSRAKELGYTPRSVTAAQAILDVRLESSNNALTTLTIPTGTIFTTTVSDATYKFITLQPFVSTTYTDILGVRYFDFTDVELFEGTRLRSSTVIDPVTLDGIVIPNSKIDTSRSSVFVAPSNNFSLSVQYTAVDNITNIDSTSTVYFVEEINDELSKFYFGDGITGKNIDIGNLVTIDYLVCNGSAPNGAAVFDLSSTIPDVASLSTYTVTTPATGGAEIESIEEVRFNAPLFYAAQNRAVTAKDYVAIINNIYNFKSVNAWGGETNEPQALGYVFIAIRPDDVNDYIDATIKQTIEQLLVDNYCPASILPIIVDADYVHLLISATVKYNPNILTTSSNELMGLVEGTIRNYATDDLGKFNQYFRYSKLSRQIDETDIAINNNTVTYTVQKRFSPTLNSSIPLQITLRFYNRLASTSVISNTFGYGGYTDAFIESLANGTLRIVRLVGLAKTVIQANAGTVDYFTGEVFLSSFTPTAYNSLTGDIRLTASPVEQDFYPVRNSLVVIKTDDPVMVTTVADTVN